MADSSNKSVVGRWADEPDDVPEPSEQSSTSTDNLNLKSLAIEESKRVNDFLEDPEDANIQAVTSGETPYTSAVRFEDLNLSEELLKGLYVEMKFERPSKIQSISLPMILTPPHKNLIAQAHNGSGKTTCFVLGMLSRVNPKLTAPQALCICPTRELAIQVCAAMSMVSVVYMRIFLPKSNMEAAVISEKTTDDEGLLTMINGRSNRTTPSLHGSISLLKSSWTFSQAAIVGFFSMLGDLGGLSALMAEFHFDKDQFADLLIIIGIAGIISQMFIFSVAWSSWVVYLASTLQILSVFAGPSGNAQGCITGLCSFAGIISPLVFSPLTALFLSDHAPFHFPGFSLMCAAFIVRIEDDVRNNSLCSTIPSDIGNCTGFQVLDLSYNRLTGEIPFNIGFLQIATLSLQGNQLSGEIPSVIGLMQALAVLDLSCNNLSGQIPPILGNLPYTEKLYLHNNKLTGSIPQELGNMSKLHYLELNDNQLTGHIPPELGKLTDLFDLNVAGNKLEGHVPDNLSSCTNLNSLNVHGNNFKGTIAAEFQKL